MTDKNIDIIRASLDNGDITPEELFRESITKAKRYEEYNSFVTILEEKPQTMGESILKDIPYALKDNISTKGILTTASSNILSNYVPVFDATVYKKLQQSGAVLMGKTTMDELAMGGTGTTAHTGKVLNPWDKERQIGGSSAGSASAVALGIVPFAIGSDTGDSIRKPASYGGIVGFKPTYGRISRYGLFPFASSLDHVGILARNVKDCAIVTDIIKGHDDKDMTSLPDDNENYTSALTNDVKDKKMFYIKEIVNPENYTDQEVLENLSSFENTLRILRNEGFIIEEESIDPKLLEALNPAYMALSCAEATSNNANLNGIAFGNKKDGQTTEEIMFNTRTAGFSELIKRRFVLGSYILRKENQEKLFLNAARVRRLITDKINELFTKYDALILPASSKTAPHFGEKSDNLSPEYLVLDNHLIIGNFGGYPSITIPSGTINNMPIAINITSMAKEDAKLLNIAYKVEEILGCSNKIAKGDEKNV
jgi:aspartyl-tRNA(Asn)/glutamyl-tRNA(Gln) amidotransferase subunit A